MSVERAPEPPPEAPPPAGLVAELALPHPEATWRALRALGAPASELLPASFPLLAGTLFGLPALAAGSLDQDVPMRGAIVLSAGQLRGVLALHALDGRELVASLTTGARPPFRAERDEATHITFLSPSAPGAAPAGSVLAVLDSYLLVAPERQVVLDAGAFVARTLSKRPSSSADLTLLVEQKPLREQLVPALRARWGEYRRELEQKAQDERKAHADHSADFADPNAVLLGSDAALESLFAVLDGAERVELAVQATEDHCSFTLSVTPAATGAAKELADSVAGGDARALLRLPESTLLALGVTRAESAAPDAAASAGDDWVRVLGDRLPARDAKLVRETLGDWERGRGASTQYGLLAGPSLAGFVSTAVVDPVALDRAGHGFLRVLALPSVRAPLAQLVGEPSVRESKPSGAGSGLATLRFAARDKAHAGLEPIELRWRIDGASGLAVAGAQAEPALGALDAAARGEHALASVAGVPDAVARLGAQTMSFAYLDGRAFGASTIAPLILSLGKRDARPAVYLEISKAAIAAGLLRLGGR